MYPNLAASTASGVMIRRLRRISGSWWKRRREVQLEPSMICLEVWPNHLEHMGLGQYPQYIYIWIVIYIYTYTSLYYVYIYNYNYVYNNAHIYTYIHAILAYLNFGETLWNTFGHPSSTTQRFLLIIGLLSLVQGWTKSNMLGIVKSIPLIYSVGLRESVNPISVYVHSNFGSFLIIFFLFRSSLESVCLRILGGLSGDVSKPFNSSILFGGINIGTFTTVNSSP